MPKLGAKRKPTTWDEVHATRWLRAETLKGKPRALKISEVYQEVLEEGGEYETIIRFDGKDKELVLNVTNKKLFRVLFGKKPQEWVGHTVVLQPEVVDAFGERTEAVRVAGSPDIPADIDVDEKLGRGRLRRTLKRWPNGSPPTSRSASGPGQGGAP